MHPGLLILFVGLICLLGFSSLSFMRRQGLSMRFFVEGLAITILGVAASYAGAPLSPLVFLIVLYVVTMRVRLLVDLGNSFVARGQPARGLGVFRFALRLGPDAVSRQIALINRGVAELRLADPERAYQTLKAALADVTSKPGAKYLAGGYYNLGVACLRLEREAEAVRYFNEAINTLPASSYALAAERALRERQERTQR